MEDDRTQRRKSGEEGGRPLRVGTSNEARLRQHEESLANNDAAVTDGRSTTVESFLEGWTSIAAFINQNNYFIKVRNGISKCCLRSLLRQGFNAIRSTEPLERPDPDIPPPLVSDSSAEEVPIEEDSESEPESDDSMPQHATT